MLICIFSCKKEIKGLLEKEIKYYFKYNKVFFDLVGEF